MEASAAIPNHGDLNVRSNIVIGARFPDHELSDQSGQRQRLRGPSNEDLRRDLRDITRTIRTDWDLGARGLRERWGAGAREGFLAVWPFDTRGPGEP